MRPKSPSRSDLEARIALLEAELAADADVDALRKAQAESRSIARFPEENPSPIIRVQADGSVSYANASARAMLIELGWKDGAPVVEPLLSAARMALQAQSRRELELACLPGRTFSFELAPISAEGYVNLYGRDITARKKAEAAAEEARFALERERDLLQAVMTSARNSHLVYLDRNFNFIRVNETYARTCGYEPAAMIGKNHFELYPHEENEAIFAHVRETGESAEFRDKPFEFPDQPDRGVTYWDWTLFPVKDDSGAVQGLVFSLVETTERKRAELALRAALAEAEEGRRTLAALMDHVPEGIAIAAGPDAMIRMVSRYGRDVLGVPHDGSGAERVAGEGKAFDADGVTPMAAEGMPLVRAIRKGEVVKDRELVWITAGGQRLTVSCNAGPIRDMAGKITGAVVAWRDVTEIKKAREERERLHREVERQRALLQAVFDASPVGVALLDGPRHVYLLANPALVTMSRGRGDVIGRPFSEVWPETVGHEVQRRLDRAFETGEACHLSDVALMLARGEDAEEVFFSFDYLPLRDGEGAVTGIVAIATETTEQVLARRTIEENAAQLGTIVESLDEGLVVSALDGRLLHWNRAALDMHGFSSLDECRRHLHELTTIFELSTMDSAVLPLEQWPLSRILRGETLRDLEIRVRRFSSDWRRIYNYGGTLVRDRDGRPLMALVTITDITERKRGETLLRQANEQLEQKVEERTAELAQRARQLRALAGELTLAEQRERRRMARVLHDHLQQQLVAAKLRVSILAHSAEEMVRKASSEVEGLLGEAVEISRSLTAELSPPILHEGGLSAGLQWLARWMTAKHALRVELTLEDRIPPLLEDVSVLLFESARELLLNAVKHAGVDSVTVSARVNKNDTVAIVVIDHGSGFDPLTLRPAGETGGGFGLFSIRERLELIGGRLEIESAPGRGSRIELIVPLALARAPRAT